MPSSPATRTRSAGMPRKNIDLYALSEALQAAVSLQEGSWAPLRERWLDRVLGAERDAEPASHQVVPAAHVPRLQPLSQGSLRAHLPGDALSALGFDLAANGGIKLDLDDRPQKSPRACVIASDPPAVVHLITRAQGGLHDYQAFLHEAGHALHYAGLDPDLPYTFRRLSRDPRSPRSTRSCSSRSPGSPAGTRSTSASARRRTPTVPRPHTLLEVLLTVPGEARLELNFWSDFENATDYKTYG